MPFSPVGKIDRRVGKFLFAVTALSAIFDCSADRIYRSTSANLVDGIACELTNATFFSRIEFGLVPADAAEMAAG